MQKTVDVRNKDAIKKEMENEFEHNTKNEKKNRIKYGIRHFLYLIMVMIMSYLVVILLLFLLAYLMYKLQLSDSATSLAVHGIYIFGAGIAGRLMIRLKKKATKKGAVIVWQLVTGGVTGIVYAMVLLTSSVILTMGTVYMRQEALSVMLMAVCGALLGTQIISDEKKSSQ